MQSSQFGNWEERTEMTWNVKMTLTLSLIEVEGTGLRRRPGRTWCNDELTSQCPFLTVPIVKSVYHLHVWQLLGVLLPSEIQHPKGSNASSLRTWVQWRMKKDGGEWVIFHDLPQCYTCPSVLRRCWLGDRKGIRLVNEPEPVSM